MKVLCFSDPHAPFTLYGWLEWLFGMVLEENPDRIVCTGDLTDQYIFSRWDKDPGCWNPQKEFTEAKKIIREIAEYIPIMDLVIGNHDRRWVKHLLKSQIPEVFAKTFEEIFELPEGWTVHREYLSIDNVYYYHGDKKGGATPAMNMAKAIGKSVVCGHHHGVAGVQYLSPMGEEIFGMDLGCGIDINSYAAHYAEATINKPILGAGVVVDGHDATYYKWREK